MNNLEFITTIILLISILYGVQVIITKNPIVSVLYLIGLFSSIAIYLIILGANFVGLSYLLVYVGAVSILFLFILMLINIRTSELTNETNRSLPLALFISIILNYVIYQLLPFNLSRILIYNDHMHNNYFMHNDCPDNNMHYNYWDSNITEISDITSIGNIIYTNYNIWLIIVSIILLLAMVGAIIITRKQIEINTDTYNYKYNKSYPNTLKASSTVLSVFAISSLGELNYKNLSLHNSIMSCSPVNKSKFNLSTINNTNNIDTINNIDNKLDISSINVIKSKIDSDLINKVDSNIVESKIDLINNINIKININPIDKINLTYQKAIECINLENKLPFIPNISIDYLNNNIYIPIIDILTNYPHFIILPILPLVFWLIKPINHTNDATILEALTTLNDTVTGSAISSDQISEMIDYYEETYNVSGGDDGEDPFRRGPGFNMWGHRIVRIIVPTQLYVKFIRCLKELLIFLNALHIELRRLGRVTLNLNITNIADRASFLANTENNRALIKRFIEKILELQIEMGEYLEQLENISLELIQALSTWLIISRVHDLVIGVFIHNLIRISSNRIIWFNLDEDLRVSIQDNMGNIFTIANTSTSFGGGLYTYTEQHLLFLREDYFTLFYDIWRMLGSMILLS